MLLTKVTINDFGVYRGRNEFDFQTKPDKPIILCGGTNGAGKTTLFESIMLCFYGQNSFEQKTSQKQYHDKILRKIHRYLGTKKAADEASVTIEFQFAHEEKIVEYQVMRMWQNNDGKIDETFTIKKKNPSDEKFVKLDSIEESGWQVFIEQLIPKGIVKLFFFDGEQIQKIADEGEIDNHIKSSFDALLGLDLVKQLINDIGLTLLRNSKGETKKILDEINRLTKEKEESEEKKDGFQNKQVHLQTKIDLLQKQVDVQEVNFKKIGGQFARNREELTIEKTRLESKLEDVEKEIRELCSDTLPFSLIPKQMEEVKNEINADQQKLQDSFEKSILEKNFQDLLDNIKSESFLPNITNDVRQNVTKQIDELLKNKIESISNSTKTTYNLSADDMNQTIHVILVNSKIRTNLTKKHEDKKRMAGLETGSNVQDVLEDYAKSLRSKKLELLESYILDKLQVLLHKQNFIEKISIDRETFQVKLYKGNDDEITKDMLSKGELQMYATAVVWGLALTSGRPLPFMIDTPLARLDEEHRKSIVEKFYPNASHQTIILSTDSEVNFEYYQKLEPYISNSFVIQYDSDKGSTKKHDTYFFDKKGERIIEV